MGRELRVAVVEVGELADKAWAVVAGGAVSWLLVAADAQAGTLPRIDCALAALGLPGLAAGCASVVDLRSPAFAS